MLYVPAMLAMWALTPLTAMGAGNSPEKDAYYVWQDGGAQCYQLESKPEVSVQGGQFSLSINGVVVLQLPLSSGEVSIIKGYYIPSVTLNSSGLATFSAPAAIEITGETEAYTLTLPVPLKEDGTDRLVCHKIETGFIPAGTGVVLKGTPNANVDFSIIESARPVPTNDLHPTSLKDGTLAVKHEDIPCFALSGDCFKRYKATSFVPNKAYITLSPQMNLAPLRNLFLDFGNEEKTVTAIDKPEVSEETAADTPVRQMGKYIVGGRLIIIRDGVQYDANGTILHQSGAAVPLSQE